MVMFLQCHKGYKVSNTHPVFADDVSQNKALTHYECFWRHPEAHKVKSHAEFGGLANLSADEKADVARRCEILQLSSDVKVE